MFLYDDLHIGYFSGLFQQDAEPHRRRNRIKASWKSAKEAYQRYKKKPSFRHRDELQPGKVWFYAASRNQLSALSPVQQQVPDSQLLVTPVAKTKEGIPFDTTVRVLWYGKPSVIFTALRKHLGSRYLRVPDLAVMPVGIIDEFLWLMKHRRPKAVVISNDHTPMSRVVIRTAQIQRVPVVYIPHAQVSEKFPPLSFDLSLLTGQAMLDTYRKAGPVKGRVELIGTPKLDEFRSLPTPSEYRTVGLCFNALDKMECVNQVYQAITQQLPHWRVLVRPHPACKEMAASLPSEANVSDPHSETAMEFLQRVEVIIANNSSIALEAAVMKREIISFDLSQGGGPSDYYGFIKHGLVFDAKSHQALIDRLARIESGARTDPSSLFYFEACSPEKSATESAARAIIQLAAAS